MYQYRNNQERTTYRITLSNGAQVTIAAGQVVSLEERLNPVPGFLEDLNAIEEKPKKEASKKKSAKKSKKVTTDEATDGKTTN